MLKIQYKMPWFITNNNTYGFTKKNVWEAMQNDFTFYVDFKMNPENNKNNHTIFCRPGMHMGVFVKNQDMITWDFWNNTGINNFNDIAFFVGKENINKRWLLVVSHDKTAKSFKCHLKCVSDEDVPTIYQEKTYDGTLHDYSDTPYNYGIANYEHDLMDEHKAICEYNLYKTGLFTTIYTAQQIYDFLETNKDCKRILKTSLPEAMFLVNTNELTRYKAYDNSGNCYNLEINVGLIKKIFRYHEHETINLNHINKQKEII